MYKSFIDSGEINVDTLCVIVGKNEAGKTSLLKALYKLNPAIPTPSDQYTLREEWPRGHRDSRSAKHIPCWATFLLSNEEQMTLMTAEPQLPPISEIKVGRDYDNKLHFDAQNSFSDKAVQALTAMLPKFVFMDEYQVFKGMAFLDQVQERVNRKNLQPDDKALLTILSLAGLKLEEQVAAAKESDRTERQYELSDASATITKRMASHWKQLQYEIRLEADGPQFWTFVKAPGDKALIKLEERSRGFQWFFSFDAKLTHETKGELQNCVILLDEPGLHLHAGAQRDLLSRLEEFAKANTLIYTSHLPFMINLQEPERIRVLSETDNGPTITEKLTDSSPEAKLTLQSALGMQGRFGLPIGDRNLTVEGPHDYWYITALSDLFARSGLSHLPEDVVISACGGANEVTYLSTFMVGQQIQVVALYDGDNEGRGAKDKFIKSWLSRYNGSYAEAILLNEAAQFQSDGAIEDLFTEDFYAKALLSVYKRQLPEEATSNFKLKPGDCLAKRAEQTLAEYKVPFNKGAVAKILCKQIREMKSVDELPDPTKARAGALLFALHAKLTRSS